ncbi:MAG: OB-fold nucleic acid binding domain-containing protein [Candidatus Diapherotrites archaeon]
METEEIINKIATKTGKTKEEILELIHTKKNKFSGLLTETGAAIIVARELQVKIMEENETPKITELKTGMKNIDLKATITKIFEPKEFETKGNKGKIQNIYLKDETGQTRLTLWNKEIEKYETNKLKEGDIIKLTNIKITEYKGEKQINMNYNSTIEKIGEEKETETKISDLKAGMNNVKIKAKIKQITEKREFQKEDRKGELLKFIIAQQDQEIKAIAWNEKTQEIEKIGEGKEIIIENAYVRENRGETELQLGTKAKIKTEEQK